LVERLIIKEFFGRSFIEIALLTFSVELFVVPLLVYQFQIFSPFALIANVLLLPLVPYAMLAAFVGGVAFFVLPGLHMLPAALAYLFLRIITSVAEQISVWPGATAQVSIGAGALLLWYAFLFLAIVTLRKYFQRHYVQAKNIS
jgi:competence protein ComEC